MGWRAPLLPMFCLITVGCTSAFPAAPDLVGGSVKGTWTQVGGTREWNLDQIGFNVGGTSSFSQVNHPYFGAISASGTVQGGVGLGAFHFEDYYDRLPGPFCEIVIAGTLTVGGSSMTGPYTGAKPGLRR